MKNTTEKKFPLALEKYLKENKIDPKILEHKTVYTAIDAANTLKRKMDEIVKALLVKADNYYYVVCLPANHNIDFKKVKSVIEKEVGEKIKTIQIPDEKLMRKILKLKQESVTAFGGLYKFPVIFEKKLMNLKKAVFSSGSFNHSVEMGVKDFSRLENVILASFGINKKIKLIKPSSKSSVKKRKSAKNKNMAVAKKRKVAAPKKAKTKKPAIKKAAPKKAAPKKKAVKKAAPKKKAKKAKK